MHQKRLRWDVLASIADRRPVHVVDLAAQLDEHPVTVDRTCARLHREGYITPANHGLYKLTDRGHRRLGKERNQPE